MAGNYTGFRAQEVETIGAELRIITKDNISKDNKERELRDSIIYAKRIQEGMMLRKKHLDRLFPESFIIFEPRDIVSGDFYWFSRIGDTIVLAAADCTGHGIPGAFMSVLGISLLNQLVIEEQQSDPSLILQRLDHKLRKAFSYSQELVAETGFHDGMDIAIASINLKEQRLDFAGANRPLYHLREGELRQLHACRKSIGSDGREATFLRTHLLLKPGDRIYIGSDGFADQFGGPRGKKFLSSRLRSLLARTGKLRISTQENELRREFRDWKNHNEQTDDVLLIGVQV